MRQPNIYIKQHHDSPNDHCGYFKIRNFFGELKTEKEKAWARFNLGIPDEFSLNWDSIKGKPDIDKLFSDYTNWIVNEYKLDSLKDNPSLAPEQPIIELQRLVNEINDKKIPDLEEKINVINTTLENIYAADVAWDKTEYEDVQISYINNIQEI